MDGERHPTGYVDQLRQIEDASSVELARIEQAYREIQRRDGAALWHAQNWRRLALVLLAAVLVTLSVIVYLAKQQSQVQAFVQTVQLTEEGRLVQVGVPVDLFAYTPSDGEWMNMLAQWVIKRRWRGDEESMKRTKMEWQWLARHTCGQAATQLEKEQTIEHPFKPGKLRSVEVKAVTKTHTPASYQVTWHEVTVDKAQTKVEAKDYVGTFTVARTRPKTMTEAIDNRLGQCVSGYNLTPLAPEGH